MLILLLLKKIEKQFQRRNLFLIIKDILKNNHN